MKKKIVSLVLCFILLVCVTGCGNSSNNLNNSSSENNGNLTNSPSEKNKYLNCSLVADKDNGEISYKERWKVKYSFSYDETLKDYKLDSVYEELAIPKEIKDVNGYFTTKRLASLDFEAEIVGNNIIFNISKDSKSWSHYLYRDYNYDETKTRLLGLNYTCD